MTSASGEEQPEWKSMFFTGDEPGSHKGEYMRYKTILASITGISSPIFGIQWTPPTLDIKIAEDLVKFLEDRRVLFKPTEMEDANHCAQSVLDIRSEVTMALQRQSDERSPLCKQLRKMRSACRRFSDKIGTDGFKRFDLVIQKSILERELFLLRETFGETIAEIAIAHGLDVEDDLAKILPFNNPL